jgi:HlyD family secretion protein
LNLKIKINTTIGLVGSSGSGKSTIVDILMGLIEAEEGRLIVDDNLITNKNLKEWQSKIGFVPQSIFLSEGTIAENIAFGIPVNLINIKQIHNSLKLANLNKLIESLPLGVNTTVGERGVQLSGGQRQRIGIARALYNDASILIFDEATSALDGITEKIIMESIHEFSGKKTIIMIAHRLKTVEKCDQIYFIENGRVFDNGTYSELISKNKMFEEMAKHA